MTKHTTTAPTAPDFKALLDRALSEPGKIHTAYTAFHNYSFGNQILAMFQCVERGIELGPLASFNAWKDKGRHVKKGAKAIELCMPITKKAVKDTEKQDGTVEHEEHVYRRFIFRRNWFVLSQTEGADFVPPALPGFDANKAMDALGITVTKFDSLDGNAQGKANEDNSISVSPVAGMPTKTFFHEVAHVVLGHVAEKAAKVEYTPKAVREVQAEAVAMMVCAALNVDDVAEYATGYIQHWAQQGAELTEKHAQQIFKATDTILRAGALAPAGIVEA